MTLADVGAGIGYLSYRLSDRVGPTGTVLAVDIDPTVLAFTAMVAAKEQRTNIRVQRSQPADPGLEPGCCDRVFLLETVHWLRPEQVDTFFTNCRDALKTDGQLVVIDHGAQQIVDVGAFLQRAEALGLRHLEGEARALPGALAGEEARWVEYPYNVYTR